MTSRIAKICALPLLLLSATAAFAHTGLASSSPKNGAVLEQSPPAIELTFKQAVRLTSVLVVAADKTERKLTFTAGLAKTFTIEQPELALGRNEVRWKALSQDGHVIGGALIVTIEPPHAASH